MISGHLNQLNRVGLPAAFMSVLSRPECSLERLQQAADGRLPVDAADWFCNIGDAQLQSKELRHTEFHQQYADIQLVLSGEETIYFDSAYTHAVEADEKKPDLFIVKAPQLRQQIHLAAGDFAVFMPGEPHQALCSASGSGVVRKAVFKVPLSMLEGL